MNENAKKIRSTSKYPSTSVKNFDYYPIVKIVKKKILSGIVNIIMSKQ